MRTKRTTLSLILLVETLKILWPFKAAVSLIVAVLIGALPLLLGRR